MNSNIHYGVVENDAIKVCTLLCNWL